MAERLIRIIAKTRGPGNCRSCGATGEGDEPELKVSLELRSLDGHTHGELR